MRIAIISPGRLPVPPVKGGAVETLINDFVMENSENSRLKIDLYGCYNESIKNISIKNCKLVLIRYSRLVEILNKITPKSFNKIQKILNEIQDYLYIRKINRSIFKINDVYDFIIVENKPKFIKQVKSISRTNILLHLHNSHIHNVSTNIFNKYDCILTVSEYLKVELINVHGHIRTPIQVLHNCVSKKFLTNSRRSKELVRMEMGFKENDFIVAFVGRVVEDKGILELIKAIKLIDNTKIKLMIIGASWFDIENKTEYIKKLEKEAEQIKTRIKFTGYIQHEKIADIEQIADIVVLPSIWNEPFGLTIIEAMSLGKLVITTNQGGIPEIFKGNDGVLIDIEGIEQNIADKIIYYFENSIERKAIEQRALKTVNELFNRDVYYKKFYEILDDLYKKKGL